MSFDAISESVDADASQDAPTPNWWIDEKTPGTGDRPDWLPEKFKSAKDVLNAYSELEKKQGTAPSEYDWTKGESWIDTEFEPFKEMSDLAKSKHVSQEVMDKMLDSVGKYLDEFKTDINSEKEKLGEDAEDRLRILNNWAKANFTEDSFNALTDNMKTADAIKALEEVRTKMLDNNTKIPTGNESETDTAGSLDALRQELKDNLDKYKTDPVYRKQLSAKFESASSSTEFVDKFY